MKNRKKLYILVVIASLVVALISGTFSYYQARVIDNNTISGTIASLSIKLDVAKVTSGEGLIPLREELISKAAESACIDSNDYTACQIYKLTLTNKSNVQVEVDGYITLTSSTSTNLKWTELSSQTTYDNAKKRGMSKSKLVSNDKINANGTKIYYIMIYLKDINTSQNLIDSGSFGGLVEFNTDDGSVSESLGNTATGGAATLISKANDESIVTYTAGDTGEMYTFSHTATSQTEELTDYRYIGASPNNYIDFNNETWRIIGVFPVDDGTGNYEQRIKIIRDSSLGAYSWDSKKNGVGSSTNNYGSNDWTDSQLMMMLNPSKYVKSGYTITNNIVYKGSQ
jgi:hypothetical protein